MRAAVGSSNAPADACGCALHPIAMRTQGADDPEDPLRKAADWLRARTGPEARGAVLGDARVDVFRSKDFYRCLRAAAPPFLDALVPPPEGQPDAEKRLEAQIGALGVRGVRRAPREAHAHGRSCQGLSLLRPHARLAPPNHAQTKLLAASYISRVDRVVKVRSKGASSRARTPLATACLTPRAIAQAASTSSSRAPLSRTRRRPSCPTARARCRCAICVRD